MAVSASRLLGGMISWLLIDLRPAMLQVSPGSGNPWTLHTLGCGHSGTRLTIPLSLLHSASPSSSSPSAADLLMRELVRLRYGVFEELVGFPGDPVYKDRYRVGSETVRTAGCGEHRRPTARQFCR